MTPKTFECYQTIRRYKQRHGDDRGPKIIEIEALMKTSTGAVDRYLRALQEEGYIRRAGRRGRSPPPIRLTSKPMAARYGVS